MSVRQSLLAILAQGPCYGYQLRAEFDRRTGSVWPLNVGQVYTTLDRLERDGLVAKAGADEQGHVFYEITEAGRDDVARWLSSPVAKPAASARDDLAVKLAVAATLPGVDIGEVVQVQRIASMTTLQDLTRAKRAAPEPEDATDVAGMLVLESLVFHADAEVRWLDHVQGVLERTSTQRATGVPLDTQAPRRGRPAKGRTSAAQGEALANGAGR